MNPKAKICSETTNPIQGPKLFNLSENLKNLHLNFFRIGQDEGNLPFQSAETLRSSAEKLQGVSTPKVPVSKSPMVSSRNKMRNIASPQLLLSKFMQKKDKISKTFLEFAKIRKVQKAIKRLRERSQFRKPDRLNTMHFNLINDGAFFKPRIEQKSPEMIEMLSKGYSSKNFHILGKQSSKYFKLKFTFNKHLKKVIKKIPIFKPNTRIKLLWDIVILFLAFLEFVLISLELAFSVRFEEEYVFGLFFKLIAILFFVLNNLANFNTTYYEYGVSVQSRGKIALNYLNNQFLNDTFAVLSLGSNMCHFPDYPWVSAFSLGFIFIYKTIKKIIKNLEETYEISGDSFDLFSLLFKTFCIAHILACFWHAIGFFTKDYYLSWLNLNNFANYSWKERYLVSIYWAFTTMCTVGYGDITPQNSAEMGFCCFVMLCGTFGLGYCVNRLGVLLSRLEEKSKEMVETMNLVDAFMHRKNINLQLRVKVKKYLEFLLESRNKNLDKESEILEKLPISLKHEILLESNMKFLREFPILTRNFSLEFLEYLALNIKPIQHSPSDIIYIENSNDQSLYLIFEGEIELFLNKPNKKELILKQCRKGEHFGGQSFFLGSATHESVRSLTFSTVYRIPRPEFIGYLSGFPNDYQRFCEIRDKGLLSKEFNDTFQGCISCSNHGHLIKQCPLLTYYPDKAFLVERMNFSRPQNRGSCQRRSLKRNTFGVKRKVASSVMQVRFNKSLMKIYYGTIDWSETEMDVGIECDAAKFNRASFPPRSRSLILFDSSEIEKEKPKRFNSFSVDFLKNSFEGESSPKKTLGKSFCLNKEDIDRMFKRHNDEDADEESPRMIRFKSKKKSTKKSFSPKSLLKMEHESDERLKQHTKIGRSGELETTEEIPKSPSHKERILENEEDHTETGSHLWRKALINLGANRKNLQKAINPHKISHSQHPNKLIREETVNFHHIRLNSRETFTQSVSKNNRSICSPKAKSKEETEAKNTNDNFLGKNLFWKEFENMKEFEFYFKKFNVSQVIGIMDMGSLQKNSFRAKKNRKNKKNGRKSRKSIGNFR